jgi:hypothetical protein
MSAAVEPNPEPMLKGRFAIYETPDGGLHLAYRADGEDEDRHVPIPALALKVMSAKVGKANLNKFFGR